MEAASSSLSISSATAAFTSAGTLIHANVRSCVTHPPRNNHAKMSKYASLWSVLGITLPYDFGGPDSIDNIFGRLGSVGNLAAYSGAAAARERMSAFGETM